MKSSGGGCATHFLSSLAPRHSHISFAVVVGEGESNIDSRVRSSFGSGQELQKKLVTKALETNDVHAPFRCDLPTPFLLRIFSARKKEQGHRRRGTSTVSENFLAKHTRSTDNLNPLN